MIPLKILNKNEKQELLNKLRKQFGIEEIPGIILKRGEERLFLFQGSFNIGQIKELERAVPIERVGIYFGKIQRNEIRLSIEGVHLLKNQIKKNIFELNKEQAEQWMMGQELNIETGKKDFLILKYKEDFLGCGKASAEKISNYIPKNRRLKSKEIIK
jgi:NOL1/NOP2/fmu family ribosome biogenesis protein